MSHIVYKFHTITSIISCFSYENFFEIKAGSQRFLGLDQYHTMQQ